MGFLAGKRILITGLLSNRSIAYGIAQAMHREGAELAFTYQNDRLQDRVAKLATDFGNPPLFPCDVSDDAQIDALFDGIGKTWGNLDGVVHSIAYAPNEALDGDFLDGISREAFRIAHDVSAYSFPALAKRARPLMKGRNGAMLAIEQRNAAGGIKGQPLELLVKDDEQNPETARKVMTELLSHNLELIIGPMTSSVAAAVLPQVDSSKTILLSPTVTTTDLTGKDDQFLRVIADTSSYATKSAGFQYKKMRCRTVAALYQSRWRNERCKAAYLYLLKIYH